jgi:DNA-3-methyladenine glycosylase II
LIACEADLAAAVAALRACDPATIATLLAACGPPPLRRREPGFEGLIWIIVSQQLSTASANAIFAKVKASLVPLDARRIREAEEAELRGCGLSAPKIRTLQAVSAAIEDEGLDLAGLAHVAADVAHQRLVAIKGIGPWTADIYLLFCLGHPDAWPVGDLALQEAARLALGLEIRPSAKALAEIGERWRPWRGVAARLLWAYYGVAKASAKAAKRGA